MDPSWLQYADPDATARDLTVEAASAIGISKALKSNSTAKSLPFVKLKALLDSRNEREILDGLRKVISMIYQNKPCLPYFSSVVKNVANPNIEIKKLVYIYLLHYAESEPDTALLSVNAIQKSLSDQNPQVRALALRTMAGMKVPVISQIVSLAIKRGISDMSPHVRKAAALAIPRCYALDPNTLPQLLDFISALIGDKQYFVVGPAVQAFLEICPDRIDMLHKHFRGLCRKLVDMDEWSQLATLKLLSHYSRQCFPLQYETTTVTTQKGFYDDEPDQTTTTTSSEPTRVLDADLALFLTSCTPLLQSRNPAVITAVASIYLHIGTSSHLATAIGPLVSLLRSPPSTSSIVLSSIVSLALDPNTASLFLPYASHFFPSSTDPEASIKLQLEILTLLFPHCKMHLQTLILSELAHFSHSSSPDLIRESVRAIGRCAQSSPSQATSARCFKTLLNQISSLDSFLVAEVLTVMRHLIQQDPQSHRKTVVRLARNLDGMGASSPAARATVVWLVGEFAALDADTVGVEEGIAPDVLRILVKGFAAEAEEVKGQIVLLAAKVYLLWLQRRARTISSDPEHGFENENGDQNGNEDGNGRLNDESTILSPLEDNGTTTTSNPTQLEAELDSHPIPLLYRHVLLLARYDTSYDLRDRARLFRNLLQDPHHNTQLAALLLLAPKPVPKAPSPSDVKRGLVLGTTTAVLGRDVAGENGLLGYEDWKLPEWVEEGREPEAKLRDGEDGLGGGGGGGGGGGQGEGRKGVAASQLLEERLRDQGLEGVVNRGSGKAAMAARRRGEAGGKEKSFDDWLEEDDEADGDEDDTEEDETDEDEEETESEEGETDEEEEDDESDDVDSDVDQKKSLIS
jgi:vesicle coat complex subunit